MEHLEHHLRRIQALATACLAFGLAGVVARLAQQAPPSLELVLTGCAVAILFALLAWAGALASGEARPGERLGLARGRLGAPALLLLVAGMLVLNLGVDSAIRAFEVRDTGSLARFDRAVAQARGPALAAAALALALLPAFAEELFFRGWLQRGLAARLRPAWAVTLAAGAFALAHVDPVHAAAAFPLGLYLGAAAQLAASTRAAILCHAAGNLVAVLVGATNVGPSALPPAFVPAALALAALALWGARRLGPGASVRGGHARGEQVPHPEEQGEEQQP
jgi:membrane protease YdiL (CAAX protease family)